MKYVSRIFFFKSSLHHDRAVSQHANVKKGVCSLTAYIPGCLVNTGVLILLVPVLRTIHYGQVHFVLSRNIGESNQIIGRKYIFI